MAKEIINNNLFFDYVVEIIDSSEDERVELAIKGVSMFPTLKEQQDRVVLMGLGGCELFIGAIALFRCNGKYLLHRLIAVDGQWLVFKGDNIKSSTERVKREDVVAIVESIIKRDGRVVSCLDDDYKKGVKIYLIYVKFYNLFRRILKRLTR
ncbi:MAG: S24/S26 family peptidase [Rikenellaceae bacterium]